MNTNIDSKTCRLQGRAPLNTVMTLCIYIIKGGHGFWDRLASAHFFKVFEQIYEIEVRNPFGGFAIISKETTYVGRNIS